MSGYALTPRAHEDIDQIWDYTVTHWGVDYAEIYLRKLGRAMSIVAENPSLGRACDDIRAGYRKYAAGEHVLFYKLRKNDIEIARILHRRMDFERHL